MDDSMFRQKGAGVPRGSESTAEDAVPSPLSGGAVEVPIWKSFVGNKDFQERQAGAIAAEKSIMASAGRGGVRWGGDNGRLFRKVGNQIEEHDAEQLAEDPEAGPFARKSLFDRERRSAAAEYDDYDLKLQDPAFKARGLTEKDRQERQFEFEALPDTDPRKAQAKAAIAADDQYRAEKAEIERRKYEAKVRATQLGNMDPDSWWANRAAIGQARKPAPVEQAQAARGEAQAADDSAMGREKELDAELMNGVNAARLAQIKAEKAEIAQARSLAGEQQVEANKAIDGVKAEAQAKVDQSVAERGFWADTVAALKRGYAGAAQSANILQGATDAENAQDIADYEKMKQANPASTEFQEFLNAKGFAESAAAFIKNPISIVSEVIAESAAQMVPSIALGFAGGSAGGALASAPTAGTAAPATVPVGAVVGSAIGAGTGSYLAEYGSAMLQSMQEAGMDTTDPKSIQAFFGDEEKLATAKEFAVKRGIPIAIFDAVSMGLAGKFMKPVEVAVKAGAKVTAGQVLKASGKELVAQAAAGAGGEAAAQLVSDGKISDGKAIFLEGIAEVGFAPLEVASNLREFGSAAPGSKEADLIAQTTTALTAIDPEAAPPTPQEIGDAAFITGKGAGVEGLAESVVIERELAGIKAEDQQSHDSEIAAIQTNLDAAIASGAEEGTIKQLRENLETRTQQGPAGRADLVRAVLKIASGRDISTLTDNELRSIGYKADKEKPGEYVELDADEAKAAGITKPMVRRGADESVVITDAALDQVEAILPRARVRVKMGETEALERASTPEWEVDTTAGPVRVRAKTPEDAERVAAETSPLGQTVRPGSAKQVSPSPGSDSGNAPGGATPVNPAAGNQSSNEKGKSQPPQGAPANQAGAQGNPAGASGGTPGNTGGAQGASGQGNAVPGTKALAEARKRIEQIKNKSKRLADAIIETPDPSMWAMMSEDGKSIYLNVERIIKRALEIGMSEAQAAQYFARVLDEEIRHMAHNDAARNQYAKIAKEAGIHFDEEAFANWREQHYGEIWQNDFVATGKDKIIRDLYSRDTTKGKTHNFDSLPAWKKAFEGIRAMSQGDKVTEGSKLWTNISDTLRQAIEAALAALKEFIDIASPTLKTEIQNLENALKQLNKPRGGTSKAGGAKPASSQAGAGTGGAAPQGGNSSTNSDGGTQPPPSDGAGSPLSVGARVSFVSSSPVLGDMAGQRIEGLITLIQNGEARIRPDFDPSISVAVPVDELTVEQAGEEADSTANAEQKAIELSNDPKKLKARLRDALKFHNVKDASAWTLDFENRRLVSPDGKMAIQWKKRKNPDQPVSYENQQTSLGTYDFQYIASEAKPQAKPQDVILAQFDQFQNPLNTPPGDTHWLWQDLDTPEAYWVPNGMTADQAQDVLSERKRKENEARRKKLGFPTDETVKAVSDEYLAARGKKAYEGHKDPIDKAAYNLGLIYLYELSAVAEGNRYRDETWSEAFDRLAKEYTAPEVQPWIKWLKARLEGRKMATPSTQQPASNEVGRNKNGDQIFADANGVRYLEDNGFRINQPVDMRPTRSGVESVPVSPQEMFDRGNLRFLTEQEVEQFQADTPQSTPTPPTNEKEGQGQGQAEGQMLTPPPSGEKSPAALTPEEEQAKKDLFDAFDGLVDGLEAAPLPEPEFYRERPPTDRLPQMQKAAQSLISAGVDTPGKLAEFLEKVAPNKLRQFSEFLWRQVNSFLMGDTAAVDWNEIYNASTNQDADVSGIDPRLSNNPNWQRAVFTPQTKAIVERALQLGAKFVFAENPLAANRDLSFGIDEASLQAMLSPDVAPRAQHAKSKDGDQYIVIYPAGLRDENLAVSIRHEVIHLAQDLFHQTEEGARLLAGAMQLLKGKDFQKELDDQMRLEYPNWDNLSMIEKVTETTRAIIEAMEDGKVSGFTGPFSQYLNGFINYVKRLFGFDSWMRRYTQHVIDILNGGDAKVLKDLPDLSAKPPPQDTDYPGTRDKAKVTDRVIGAVKAQLVAGQTVTVAQIRNVDPWQVLSKKELDEAIEAGITAAAYEIVENGGGDVPSTYQRLVSLYENQPSLNAKTSTSKINQAYSTPSPMAYVASRIADITGGNVVTEHSGGHGMLLMETGDNQIVQYNEIDPSRRERTLMAIPQAAKWDVSGQDGTTWNPARQSDRLIGNPPFGAVMGENGNNIVFATASGETTAIDHAIMLNALESMDENGRAVFIIGGPAKTALAESARKEHYARGAKGAFFKHLHDNYGVIDHFTVNGDLYAKQGAGWNVDIIVIQGKKPARTALPSAKAPRMIDSWDELFNTIPLTDEQRIAQNTLSEEEVRNGLLSSLEQLGNRPKRPQGGGAPGSGSSQSGSGNGSTPRPDGGNTAEASMDEGAGDGSGNVDAESGPDGTGNAESAANDGRPGGEPVGNDGNADGGVRSDRGSESVKSNDKFQDEYVPGSQGPTLGTLIPKNLTKPVRDALADLKDRRGELHEFVRDELGYAKGEDIFKYFAAEQIDALALAIDNFYRNGALIVGDQTGIGKGRVVAGLIKWSIHHDLLPVFVTKDAKLMNAMLKDDMPDIGVEGFRPAITNNRNKELVDEIPAIKERNIPCGKAVFEAIADTGELPEGTSAIFTTYSQICADTPSGTSKQIRNAAKARQQAPPDFWRMAALRRVSTRTVMILDESHLAAGDSIIRYRFADLLTAAKHVYFSSATFAKRPVNMALYFRTNMSLVTGGDINRAIQIMEQGGVPAMQLASNMLARDGQMIRRERSFEGVDFETVINRDTQERDYRIADQYTTGLRKIVELQNVMADAADNINAVIANFARRVRSPSSPKVESVNFSSKLHNMVSQYLLAIKSESAVRQAIKEIKAGNKVVVAVQNTMQSAINKLTAQGRPLTFHGLLMSYVDEMRFFKTGRRNPDGSQQVLEIRREPDPELADFSDRELQDQLTYSIPGVDEGGRPTITVGIRENVAQELIRRAMIGVFLEYEAEVSKLDIGDDIPLSPIDYMRQAMEREGVVTNEITGRNVGLDENGDIYQRNVPASTEVMGLFNNEDTHFIVLNQSGSTGISLHASEKFADKRRRTMIVVQPNLDINEFMQTLGRIHRSGQVSLPRFVLLQTALPAEFRPAAILGVKMSMLNANTTSNDESAVSEGNTAVDIFNQYGDEVVHGVLQRDRDLLSQLSIFSKISDLLDRSGNLPPWPTLQGEEEIASQPDGYFARLVTGYLAIMPAEEQEIFWEKTSAEYTSLISYLDQIGQNQLRAQSLDIKAKTLSREIFTGGTDGDSVFAEPSYLETVQAEIGKKPMSAEEANAVVQENKNKQREIYRDYAKKAQDKIEELAKEKAKRVKDWSEKEDEWKASQREQASVIAYGISQMGQWLTFRRPDGTTGYGVIESVKFDEDHILTPSKQIFTVFVNDTNRSLKIPATKLRENYTPESFGGMAGWEETKDDSSTRSIITGNLLAALMNVGDHAHVISYTTENGDTQMGIMLPANFTARRQAQERRRVKVESPEQFADAVRGGAVVINSDSAVKITTNRDGAYVIQLPASRAAGGKYWRDPRLNRMTIEGEFSQVSNRMEGTIAGNRLQELYELLSGSMGETMFINAEMSEDGDSGLQAAELPALRADSPEWKSMSKAQRADYLKKKGGLEAAPLPETDANIGRLRSKITGGMNKPLLDEARRQQAAFGNISTPRLANPGNTARSRAEQDIVDALYEHERQVRKDRDVFAEARRRVNDDPKGVEEKLLQIAEGKTFATDDADHVAFAMLINQRAAEAGNDLTKHEANMALRMAYRAMRAEAGRELRIGYDKFMKPEERARKAIADAIYTPTLAIQKRAEQLNFSPEKQREYIRQAASERLQSIEKALKKMGVTLDEILSGQAFLSLSQNAILKQALAVRTAEERMVVKMLQAKTPLERIKKKTGFTEERIEGIRAMLYEELLEKAKEKVRAGMKLENFKDAMKGLQAADLPGAGLTEEQIEAEARRIVEIGFGIPRETPKASVAKPKRTKPKADTDPHQADWTRPVFTDGLNDYDFDTKDRAEIMKRVEAIRGIASATGKINTLTGKKKAQAEALLKEIDAILAKYGTDSEKIFEAAKPVEEYAFNIHDRAHVAAIARAIQAIDADVVDKGLEWVYSSILSGIQTMTVNAMAAVPAAWDMTVGRGFEMAVNTLFRDKSAATPQEVKYILKAARPALARAMSNASATWGSELPMFDEDFLGKAADLDKLFDGHAPKIGVIGGTKGRIIRTPLRLLLATDEFNRTAIAVAEVGAMAYRVGVELSKREGSELYGKGPGTPEFDKFLAKEVNTAGSFSAKLAADKASKLIFTNPLPGQTNPITDERAPIEGIGDVVGAGAALLNSLVTTKTDNLFAKALLAILRVSFFPFQRTPFNLIRRGVRHTLNPISLIDIAVLMTKNSITVDTNGKIRWKWNAKGRNPEIVVRLAQQLQGATLLAALMAMAAGEGDEDDQDKPILITGSQPFTLKGMAEREAQMRSGLGPYRISFRRKDGSERFGFNYGRLEPLATTLGTTIDSIKAYKRTNRAGEDGMSVASSVLGGLAAQAQDKTYLQGFSDLFSLVNNVLESDDSLKDNRKFQQFMASRVAMAFPNIIKQPIREADPMYRARAEDFMQELLYQAMPYGQKAPKTDPYGRLAEKTGNPLGRVFDVTDAGTDPVNPYDKALLRWRDSGQGKPWFPAPIVNGSFKNTRTGKEQDMTQEQLAEFRDIAGKRVTAMLKREAINLESPTIIDIEKIKEAHSKARSEAKKMIAYKHSR